MESNNWKQPTPTDINNNENLTFLDRAIFREILSLCFNKDRLANFIHNNRWYSVELKKGQCILQVSKIAKDLKVDRKRVRKSIEILSKWYSQLDSQAMPYGLIVTVKDYDEIVRMDSQKDNQRTVKGQSKDNQRTPRESVKSVESVKSDIYTQSDKELQEVVDYYNETFKKNIASTRGFEKNFRIWRKVHSVEDIKQAIKKGYGDSFWKDKLTLTILFRIKNKNGEDVDYIEDFKNRGRDKWAGYK